MASTKRSVDMREPDDITLSSQRGGEASRPTPRGSAARALLFAVLCSLASLPTLQVAHAQTYTGTYTGAGESDAATAVFSLVNGTTLQIVLTNTSTYSSGWNNGDLLSGLFFDIATAPNLTPLTAMASGMVGTSGCTSIACNGSPPVDVGYNWSYVTNSSGFSGPVTTTARYGLGAAGFSSETGGFGSKNNIFNANSPNYTGTNGGVGGLDFSIIGSNYASGLSSNNLLGVPLAQDSVTFQFSLPSPVATLNITNVTFAYGTAPDGSLAATLAPEPASTALLATSLGAVGILRRRRRRA